MGKNSVLGIVAAIVLALGLGAGLSVVAPDLLSRQQDGLNAAPTASAQGASSAANLADGRDAPVVVAALMPIAQDDMDDASTLIPVQVDGTTAAGERYSKLHFANGSGEGVNLVPGEYRMHVPAGYMTGENVVHLAPEEEVRVKIPVEAANGDRIQATIYVPSEARQDNYVSDEIRERVESLAPGPVEMLVFPAVELADVTEEMLNEIVSFAKQDPSDSGRAQAAKKAILKAKDELKKAQEKAAREAEELAAKEEEQRLAEEQKAAAREEGRQALEAAKKQAEEEKKAKEAEEKKKAEEDAAAAAAALNGWWSAADASGIYYRFADGNYEMYQGNTTAALSMGSLALTRLTDEQAAQVGGAGYLLNLGGPQSYVLLDAAPGVLQCRNTGDLSSAGAGDLSPTADPNAASSGNAQDAQDAGSGGTDAGSASSAVASAADQAA